MSGGCRLMTTPTKFYLEAPRRLRTLVRARESSLIVLAAIVGVLGGALVSAMSAAVNFLHEVFFNLPRGARLSAQMSLDPLHAIAVPAIGGLLFGLSLLLLQRWRPGREIDPIEANALHGGRMSFRGSIIVALQTIWSSGVGSSVGMEAGYTQLASGTASSIGRAFHLRRSDQRLLLGCGAAAAIAGAFGAPLAGAFYAFELIVSGYTPASLASIGIAAVTGYAVAHQLEPLSPGIIVSNIGEVSGQDIVIAIVLGFFAALVGIGIMRAVAMWDNLLTRVRLWQPLRPAIGGLIVGLFALKTPQVMSSGHGALHLTNLVALPMAAIALLFVLKIAASIVSLGSGFRGGLFFSSLLCGALGGHLFASAMNSLMPGLHLETSTYAVIGMSALSASVIGGPLTMTFIALETTGNLWLTTAVLIAVIVSTQMTRELFGYSFATWRFHLRGETIRSAADVGWIRDLAVGRMMRSDVTTVPVTMPIDAFRQRFPLGSKTQVVAIDHDQKYAGVVFVANAHSAADTPVQTVGDIAQYRGMYLLPEMSVRDAVVAFDRAEAESLAVVDHSDTCRVIGLLTEAHALRRYAEETERHRPEMLGDA
jgi:CIC family chloride channel protein